MSTRVCNSNSIQLLPPRSYPGPLLSVALGSSWSETYFGGYGGNFECPGTFALTELTENGGDGNTPPSHCFAMMLRVLPRTRFRTGRFRQKLMLCARLMGLPKVSYDPRVPVIGSFLRVGFLLRRTQPPSYYLRSAGYKRA